MKKEIVIRTIRDGVQTEQRVLRKIYLIGNKEYIEIDMMKRRVVMENGIRVVILTIATKTVGRFAFKDIANLIKKRA